MKNLLEGFGVICFAVALSWFIRNSTRRRLLPPGPPGDPLIGHLRIMPTHDMAETLHEWSKTYGDVMYLKVFGREMIVLGSVEVAQALLEGRGANYSCRPKFTIFDLMGWSTSLVVLQYGKRFLKHRKMLQQYFTRRESFTFNDILAEESRLLVKLLSIAKPGSHSHYAQRFTLSNVMQAAFGHKIRSDDDPLVKIVAEATHGLNNCGPVGSTPPDFFPWFQYLPSWFPGTHYAFLARSYFGVVRQLHDGILNSVRDGMGTQSIEKSFAYVMLKELGDNPDSESIEDVKSAAATIITGGEDTTFASLSTFLLAMVLHPKVQKQAYDEITSVIGHDRLPDLTDRERLPFVDCILQETLRWHPAGQLGVPHRTLEADVYNGMFIPKGAVIITNIAGMSMDERVYSNPKKFDPSRFLPAPQGKGEPPFMAAFGFGRRICPGRYFADLELWNAFACVLATLELVPVRDEAGNEKFPEVAFSEGLVSQPRPFEMQTRPRSAAARALIAQIEA